MISVVMPVFNSSEYLTKAINSVINQTYNKWELIIIDDNSADNSRLIINKFAKKDRRIKPIFLKKNKGASNARNEGIKKAKGKYVAFLDSDDFWNIYKLEKQREFMEKNRFIFSYTNYKLYENYSSILCPKKISYNLMLKSCFIGCSTVMINISKLGKIYFNNFRIRNDYVYWLKILKKVQYAYCYPKKFTTYRKNINGLSSNYLQNLIYYFKVMKLEKQNTFKILVYLLPIYLYIQIFKKFFRNIYNYFVLNYL